MATRPPIDFQEPITLPPGAIPAQQPVPQTGFLENLHAGVTEMEIAGNIGSSTRNLEEAYRPILDVLGDATYGDEQTYYGPGGQVHYRRRLLNPANLSDDVSLTQYGALPRRGEMRDAIFAEIRRRRAANPQYLPGVPDNPDEFERQANERTRAQLQGIRDVQSRATGWGRVGGFVGGVAGSFEDPVNLATLPIGGAETTFIRQVGRAVIENMIIEAVSQPQVVQNYAALGEDQTLSDSINSVLMAGVAGGAFHAGARGASEIAGRTIGPAYDTLVHGVFNSLPEDAQRRWADRMTVGDHSLVDLLRTRVPEENWTPDLRAAVNVVQREHDIALASPFEPGPVGDAAHGETLAMTLRRIADSSPAVPEVAPVIRSAPVPTPANAPPVDRQWHAIVGNEGGTGRHGEFLTSPAGAIGPAQVMPGTAPHAAQLAGLPWDEHRYRTDPEYNLALGRAYYEEQLRTFGDPAMAAAAYNAGPGSARTGRGLRGAMARAERAGEPGNWEAYLPHETQQYVRDFRRRVGGTEEAHVEAGPTPLPAAEPSVIVQAAEGPIFERPRADGGAPVEMAIAPSLRRDLFADDVSHASAQEAIYRQHNDIPEEVQTRSATATTDTSASEPSSGQEATPIRVYHGGPGIEGEVRAPFFASEDQAFARTYAEDRGQGRGRVEAFDLRPTKIASEDDINAAARQAGLSEAQISQGGGTLLDQGFTAQAPQIVTELRRRGFDAARFHDFAVDGEHGKITYAALHPSVVARAGATTRGAVVREQASTRALATSLRPSLENLAQFDEPMGKAALAQTDSIEHDLMAAIEKNPALRERPFIVDAVGESATLDAILQELDADKAAAAALRGCL